MRGGVREIRQGETERRSDLKRKSKADAQRGHPLADYDLTASTI